MDLLKAIKRLLRQRAAYGVHELEDRAPIALAGFIDKLEETGLRGASAQRRIENPRKVELHEGRVECQITEGHLPDTIPGPASRLSKLWRLLSEQRAAEGT